MSTIRAAMIEAAAAADWASRAAAAGRAAARCGMTPRGAAAASRHAALAADWAGMAREARDRTIAAGRGVPTVEIQRAIEWATQAAIRADRHAAGAAGAAAVS